MINPNQITVAKIYPGNYTNVLRYWHETTTVQYDNANGASQNLANQPVGGPVGVVVRPGWIAQQAIGYVDMSYQALGSVNQLAYYTQPYGSGQNGAQAPFSNTDVIIPSPDFHKDVRADIANGITAPASALVYRASLRLDGGDLVSSGIAGGSATPAITLVPSVNQGIPVDGTVVSGQIGVTLTGSNSRLTNGTYASTNVFNSSQLSALASDTTWKLFSSVDAGASGVAQGSGVYDPRASANLLAGDNKALAICEVCWLIPDQAPLRQDLALQPDGLTESQVYTSTAPV
jgi:hypothetical protein